MKYLSYYCILLIFGVISCSKPSIDAEILITGGHVIDGTGKAVFVADVAVSNGLIVFVGDRDTVQITAEKVIDAEGFVVAPGFIDPHTHSLGDLKSDDKNSNLNYLTQGVTTVVNGNDGEGPYDVSNTKTQLETNGIGTNTALLVGHGTVRKVVLGGADVAPDSTQLEEMKALVKQAMEQGAFGFSTGLYYAPGSYATTEEVIALTQVVRPYGGLYESHIRDESTYNIGLVQAIKEALRIGEEAGVPVHIAHIKALGVDVWGKSNEIIEIIENAQNRGLKVTADQYPWKASGTHIENALISRWVMEGSEQDYYARLKNEKLLPKITEEMAENLRKRGGAEALLITADCRDTTMLGKTLAQISDELESNPVDVALMIAKNGGARVASFNMSDEDVENFMKQPWVMTSSDGTKGHPRKYASYPQKYKKYVLEKKLLTLEEFVHRSSKLVTETFGIKKRGAIIEGYYADIIIFHEENYKPSADFYHPEALTTGVPYVLVNGQLAIDDHQVSDKMYGVVITK